MIITLSINKQEYEADFSKARSIAITLVPDGDQPNHFNAPKCTSLALKGETFLADTRAGGSCNVHTLSLIPHCNGTHTESISHIINQMIPVHQAIRSTLFPCAIITVTPTPVHHTSDQYQPNFEPEDLVVTKKSLNSLLDAYETTPLEGLVIRTFPNDASKTHACYNQSHCPPYFTTDAMELIMQSNISHLLVDFPSVDKMFDQGMMSNHRHFWRINHGEHCLNDCSEIFKTITEMVYVENDIPDGLYLCQLNVPQILTDAVPSRPLLIPLNPLTQRPIRDKNH